MRKRETKKETIREKIKFVFCLTSIIGIICFAYGLCTGISAGAQEKQTDRTERSAVAAETAGNPEAKRGEATPSPTTTEKSGAVEVDEEKSGIEPERPEAAKPKTEELKAKEPILGEPGAEESQTEESESTVLETEDSESAEMETKGSEMEELDTGSLGSESLETESEALKTEEQEEETQEPKLETEELKSEMEELKTETEEVNPETEETKTETEETESETAVTVERQGKAEILDGGVYWKRTMERANRGIVVKDGGDYSSSGLKQHLKYIDSDGQDPDSGDGKWRMVYCLDDTLATPNGNISWDGAGRMRKEIVYCTVYGVRYWGEEAVWPAYRTGLGWKADYVATSYAIHIFNGEYTLADIREKAEDPMYAAIEKMVYAAQNSSNYGEFNNMEMREFKPDSLSYHIEPGRQDEWISCTENGAEGYRTSIEFIPATGEARNVSSVELGFIGESHGASIIKTQNGQLQVGAESNAAAFYLFMPREDYLREAASGGCELTVQAKGRQAVYYSTWVYDPPEDVYQHVTFLEASYGGAEILGQVSAGVHQSQGKVQLTKRDRDTGMPVSGAVFSIYEWSNAKQDWKEHSRLSDLGQGKYQSMDLAGTADNGGRFKIAEVKAGTGYLNEKWEQEFNLADHENGLFQFEVSNQHYKGSVTVWKRDSENKEKLAGAVFTIYEWNNQKGSYESIGKLEYDVQNQCYKKDVIHYKNTNEGRFRLAETAPPPGYASNGWTAEFSLDLSSGDSSQNISYEVKNEIYKASLFVEKTDAESGKKLAGAEFTVYEWDKDSQSYHKYSTLDYDEKLQQYKKLGMRWTQKNEGKFKVMETKAPAGYQMNGFQKEFAINPSGNNVTVTFSYPAVDKRQKGIIRLQKSDKETGGKAQGQASLEGAVYLIFKKESYKAGDDENSASYAGQIVTGKEGTGESPELELGSYYVVEKKAGPGYLVDGHAYEVQLKADNQSERVFYAECPVSEQIIRGDILIYKYVQSNDPEQEVQEPLDGAEFRITSVTTGKAVTIHTDEQGMAMTKGEDGKGLLPYDTYLIEEINTPEGFKAIEPFHMKVEEDKKVYTYIIENKRILGAVQIIKKDAQTGMIIPAAGAKFKILDAQGNQIQMKVHYPEEKILDVFETDEKGQFLLPEKLTAGEYRLIEVEAPEGYMLNCEEIRFQVDGGSVYENPVIVVCTDTPAMGRIIIEKTGAADGRPIGGVTFVVRAAEDIVTKDGTVRVPQGVIVDEMITDENGRAFGNELYLGIYEVEEKDSVEGYLENSQKYKVTLSYEGQETEVMEETVYIQNEEMRPAVKVAKLADRTTGAKLVDGRYDGEKKPGTYLGSETVNYTISVTNSGNTGVRDLIVEDEISEELRPFVEEGSEGFAAVKGQVLYTKLGDRVVISQAEKNRLVIDRLEIGDSVELHYVFKLTADAEREKGLDNTVRVAGNYTDHGKDKEIPEDEDDHDNDKIDLSEPPETESEPPETESEPSETEAGSPETESEPKDTESEQPETESELPETETEPPESEEPPSESEAVPTEPFTEPPAEGGESESERETEPPETKSTEPPETEKEQKIVPPVPPSHGSSPSSPVKTNDAAAGRILEMFVIMACALAAVLCIGIFRRNRNKNQDKKKKQPPMQ